MNRNKENFFENNLFRYDSCSCNCVESIQHTSPGDPPIKTLKLHSIPSKTIRFAFAAQEGLLRLAPTGSIEEKNILSSLISLPNGKSTALFEFFKTNGFLFPINHSEYESIDKIALLEIVNRIKATVLLMSAISAIRKNYQKILHLTLYLLLSEPVELKMQSPNKTYNTCIHPFLLEFKKAPNLYKIDRGQEEFNKSTYSITDTIYPPIYELDISEYNDIINGYASTVPGTDSPLYQDIANLYCNTPYADPSIRCITDFLFHYQREVGIIKTIDYEKGLEYYIEPDNAKFNNPMKNALINIAKIIIGEEINTNLDGIYPQYNISKMTPAWKVDSLMSAIYFSIFYMKPDLELYRLCQNPTCSTYFSVKTTSTRNKYCSPECCNRACQSRHRKKKREQQNQ